MSALRIVFLYGLKIIHAIAISDSWRFIRKCDVLLYSHDSNRSYVYRGQYYSNLIDTLGDKFIENDLIVRSIAKPYSKLVSDIAYLSPFSYNRANFMGQIFSLHTVKVILNFIKKPSVFHIVWKSKILIYIWMQILKRARPKVVIGILPDVNLCQAARLLHIPVYDLQHGMINSESPWYGERYQCLKNMGDLPSGFLCWDQKSAAIISKWAEKKGIHVLTIGNIWFLRFIWPEENDMLVQNAIDISNNILDDNRPSILVSLQWGMRQFYPEKEFNGVMVKALEETILETLEDYNWIVRLHPVQLMGEEREGVCRYLKELFGSDRAETWINTSTLPLPLILKRVNLHITDFSSIVIEASWMGVQSGILNQEVKSGGKFEDYYVSERNSGMAEVIDQNPEAIKSWISKTLQKGKGDIQIPDTRDVRDAFIKEVVEKCRS